MKKLFFIFMLLSFNVHALEWNFDRKEPIIGLLIDNKAHIKEVESMSNTFAAMTTEVESITAYLDANKTDMVPMVELRRILYDSRRGVFNTDVSEIITAIKRSHFSGDEIMFMFDEPFHTARASCRSFPDSFACVDIKNGYLGTQKQLDTIISKLRKELAHVRVGIFHVEAYPELILQKNEGHVNVVLIKDADYVGFDCYGDINSCGDDGVGYRPLFDYAVMVYEAMTTLTSTDGKERKIFLVPGGYWNVNDPVLSHQNAIQQMVYYLGLAKQYPTIVGGYGVFAWKVNDGMLYVKDSTMLTLIMKFVKEYL